MSSSLSINATVWGSIAALIVITVAAGRRWLRGEERPLAFEDAATLTWTQALVADVSRPGSVTERLPVADKGHPGPGHPDAVDDLVAAFIPLDVMPRPVDDGPLLPKETAREPDSAGGTTGRVTAVGPGHHARGRPGSPDRKTRTSADGALLARWGSVKSALPALVRRKQVWFMPGWMLDEDRAVKALLDRADNVLAGAG